MAKSSIVTVAAGAAAMATLLLLLLLPSAIEAAISCNDVTNDLSPCLNYLVSGSGKPPSACCSGVSTLKSAASTSSDKKAACACIKSAAGQLNVNEQLAKDLPSNCGVKMSFTLSPDVDCSKIG